MAIDRCSDLTTPDAAPALSTDERRRALIDALRRDRRINVRETSAQLGVSEVTVRADLDALEQEGLAQRVWGGAVFLFFFSSRRRHTRCYRDWSSDVCSSD